MSLVKKVQCPECAKQGGDRHKDNLCLYDDGSAFCFACNKQFPANPSETTSKPTMSRTITRKAPYVPYQLPQLEPLGFIRDRQIGEEELQAYRVGVGKDGGVYFPAFDENGDVVGAKIRSINRGELANGRDKYIWDRGSHPRESVLWGLHLFNPRRPTIYCTGETDTLSVYKKFGRSHNVLGNQMGEKFWAKAITKSYDKLSQSREHIVIIDNDDTGKEVLPNVIEALPTGRVKVCTPPPGCKDASDMLRAGCLEMEVRRAQAVTPPGIKDRTELYKEVYASYYDKPIKNHDNECKSFGIPGFDYITGGCQPGKVIVVAGDTGIGKSTLIEWIAWKQIEMKRHVLYVTLEGPCDNVQTKFMQTELQQQMFLRDDERGSIPLVDKQRFDDAFLAVDGHIHLANLFGSVSEDELERRIDIAKHVYDAKLVVLDHLTAACTKTGGVGIDFQRVDSMMYKLQRVAIEQRICVIAITHINSPERGGSSYTTDSKGRKIRLPGMHELRGSRAIEHVAAPVVGVTRHLEDPVMWMYTLKRARYNGPFVPLFSLGYDYNNFRYEEFAKSCPELEVVINKAKGQHTTGTNVVNIRQAV